MAGLNYSVSCSDKHACICVELEAFFHIGCCSVEVDSTGLGSITEGVCTCDREYLCQVLDRAVSVESICKSYNGIGVCLSTAERTDLTVVDILSVQSCVNCEGIAYSVYSAVTEVAVDVIDVDGSCVNACRFLSRLSCGLCCRFSSRLSCGLICRSLCGSLCRLSAARSEGTNELEVIDLDLVLVDDSGKHVVCNSQSSHRVGDLSLAGCGYLIFGNDQRAVVGIEVERVFIKFRCRSVVGDSAYDTCVSSGLVLSYREYLVDILEGRAGSLDVLLIDLFEDGRSVGLLALQGADIAALDLSAVEVGVYCELVADVEFLLVGDVALKVVDLYDSLITGCRCICRSFCRSLCGSLSGFVGRSFCRNLSGFDCRFVGRSLCRSLCGSLCGSICREHKSLEGHGLGESLVYYFALIDDSGESRVGNCQSLESCLDVSCAGSNYCVGCSDQRACIGVELEAFFHIGCCSVEVDGTGLGSVSEGVSTCDREYLSQVLDRAVCVKSVGKSYNGIGVCLNTAERTDLTVVDLGSVQQCVSCELVTYCELFALAKVTVDIIDVDDSLIGRSICRSLCGSFGRSFSGFVGRSLGGSRCGIVCRSLSCNRCGSLGRYYIARSEGTLEFEIGLYDLASVDDSGKIIVCNCKGSHCIGDGSLAGCGYLILGNDQRAVVSVEVERIFIKFRCRSVVGDSAYDTCVSSGLFLGYREYLIDILEGCAGCLNVLLIDLFEDGIGVSLLALQGADIPAAEVSAVKISVYGELVADVVFLNVINFACETVDGYDSLITGCRCICGSFGRSLCGSLCGSLCRSFCGSLGRSLGGSFCGSLGRSLGGNISGREVGASE